jgi:phosphatidylglycerophosphatase C
VDGDGRCTGRLAGENCRGPEKARRLTELLAGRGALTWAYGDSSGDREMLAMARHPVRVRNATIPAVPPEGQR